MKKLSVPKFEINWSIMTTGNLNKARTVFQSRWHITLLAVVWMISLLLPGCSQRQPTETTNAVDLEIVSTFFNNLGEERYIINPNDRPLTPEEVHVFRWTITAISEFMEGPDANYDIHELRLSKTMVGSPGAYELTRHTSQGFSKLRVGQFYIQLHAVHIASDPELHGVIDMQGPTLISFWEEGA